MSTTYVTDLKKGFCNCPAWIFQKRPSNARTCKHLLQKSQGKFRPEASDGGKWEKRAHPKIMLYSNKKTDIKKGWWCSEKLDGVRGYWDGHDTMLTRGGLKVVLPARILKQLPKDGTRLDGEFWIDRGIDRSKVLAAVENQHRKYWQNVRFITFDAHKSEPYKLRYAYLKSQPRLDVVRMTKVGRHLKDNVAALLEAAVAVGAEGIVCRDPEGLYKIGRNAAVVKVKPSFTGKAKLITKGRNVFEEITHTEPKEPIIFKMIVPRTKSIEVDEPINFIYRGRTSTGKPLYPKLRLSVQEKK